MNPTRPNSRTLLLVPTDFELATLGQLPVFRSLIEQGCDVAVCGFGPIVSAAKSNQLIAERNPSHVFLVGIAGTYAETHAIGSAYSFDRVSCFGIGMGTGDHYQSATQMGWAQWKADDDTGTIEDTIVLTDPKTGDDRNDGALLTCTASSTSSTDVQQRLALFPKAVAEDMEGFAVAVACQFARVPLTIVRGISNRAGDRDKSNWEIETALSSAAEYVADLFGKVKETEKR